MCVYIHIYVQKGFRGLLSFQNEMQGVRNRRMDRTNMTNSAGSNCSLLGDHQGEKRGRPSTPKRLTENTSAKESDPGFPRFSCRFLICSQLFFGFSSTSPRLPWKKSGTWSTFMCFMVKCAGPAGCRQKNVLEISKNF